MTSSPERCVQPAYAAVVGPGASADEPAADLLVAAEEVGRGLAAHGVVVVTGGLGGVMAAAARGATSVGGTTVALLPGLDRADANAWSTVVIPTGLGELRNGLIVRSADVVVAVGGSWGTLSEVALAVRTGVPVVGLRCWEVVGPTEAAVAQAASAGEAVELALAFVRAWSSGRGG